MTCYCMQQYFCFLQTLLFYCNCYLLLKLKDKVACRYEMQSIMDALGVDLSLPSVVIQHDHKYAWYLVNQQTGPFRDVVISSMLHPVTQWYFLYFSTVIYCLWLRMQCSLWLHAMVTAPSPTICRALLSKLSSLNCVNLIFCPLSFVLYLPLSLSFLLFIWIHL